MRMRSKYLDSRIQICTQTLLFRDSHYVKTIINVTLRSKHPSFSIQNLLHHYESEIQTQPCSCLNKPFHFFTQESQTSLIGLICARIIIPSVHILIQLSSRIQNVPKSILVFQRRLPKMSRTAGIFRHPYKSICRSGWTPNSKNYVLKFEFFKRSWMEKDQNESCISQKVTLFCS